MAGMVTLARELLHQGRHARQRPDIGVMTGGQRPGFERGHDLVSLCRSDAWLDPRRAFAFESLAAALAPLDAPASDGLPGDFEGAGDVRIRPALLEQTHRLEPSPLHCLMISFLCHAQRIPNHKSLSPYFTILNKTKTARTQATSDE
jgi:hypothetical protein